MREIIEDFKKGSVLAWLYCGSIILFWLLFLYDGFTGRNPGATFIGIIRPFWSPTNDPVLNFLIDAVIVVLGLAIGVGILVTGFFLLIVLLVLSLSIWFLSWLASISITGAILSASIVIGTIILIVRHLLKSRPESQIDTNVSDTKSTYNSGSYYSDSTSNLNSISEPEVSPIFKAEKIDKAILSDDKILKDSSGKKIGRLEKAIFSNDQIIRDSGGKKGGRIEQSIWDKDKQIIKGADGKKAGEIKTNFWGNRIIVDKDGKKIGTIEKNI